MGAFNYKKTQDTALALLKKFGFTGEVLNFSDTVDIVEGTTGNVYQSTVAQMVSLPSVDSLMKFDEGFKEALVQGRAKVFIIAAKGLTFTPKSGDLIEQDGVWWEIGSGGGKGGLMPLNPAGTPVTFIAGCMVSGRQVDENALNVTAFGTLEDALDVLVNQTLPATFNA